MATTTVNTEVRSMDIAVFVPFDIGGTYVFKVPNDLCEQCIWKNIFRDANQLLVSGSEWEWNTDQLGEMPTFYRESFGIVARYRHCTATINTSINLNSIGNCFAEVKSLEIIFFPRGIGVLVLRVEARENVQPDSWRDDFKSDRGRLKEALQPILSDAQRAYISVMNGVASRKVNKFVFIINLPGRGREVDKARFPFAVGFTDTAKATLADTDATKPATVNKSDLFGYCYSSSNRENKITLCLDVGWGETTVYNSGGSEAAKGAIVDAFIVATASWFSLVLMNRLVSQFLRDLFVDIAGGRRRLSDREGQKIRLAFMDASNASRPVSWTFRERDLLLLDRIHETWCTKRWWRKVEERTTLLAAHHNEVAADIRRNSEDKLARLVIILSIMAAFSAIKDIGDMFKGNKELTIILVVAAILGAVALVFWARAGEAKE